MWLRSLVDQLYHFPQGLRNLELREGIILIPRCLWVDTVMKISVKISEYKWKLAVEMIVSAE